MKNQIPKFCHFTAKYFDIWFDFVRKYFGFYPKDNIQLAII